MYGVHVKIASDTTHRLRRAIGADTSSVIVIVCRANKVGFGEKMHVHRPITQHNAQSMLSQKRRTVAATSKTNNLAKHKTDFLITISHQQKQQ